MATLVIMPRQGQSVESCIITAFNVKVGDEVKKGDTLFSYETDKSSFDEPSPEDGKVLAIFKEEGDDVPCLENVLVLGADGEDISALVAASATQEEAAAPAAVEAAPAAQPEKAAAVEAPAATDVKVSGAISPRARLLAEKTHVDLLKATPTGPDGRIIERDVQRLCDLGLTVSPAAKDGYTAAVEGTGINGKVVLADLNAPAAPAAAAEASVDAPEYEDVKLPNIRKVIAKSMHQSLSTMAQLTLNTSFDASKLLALRASLKAGAEKMGLANITLNDMVLFAVSKVLLSHKDLNAHYLDDTMRYFKNVNIGIAVDTPRGLMVPTVFASNKLSLNDLSREAKAVITEAQNGTINPDKLKGASFTVTNLGSLGIESFTPVINPPQTGILGVCGITRRVKEVDGEDVTYPAMGLSLTFDHRALDGAPAAKFLKELCFALENFDLLMTK
ncbi:MAG: 2-oxo acid dehydrogenase subunit E2 [Clostridia bacterium]|nr:2-oxo acid dehydrogenase subunit E2 [Clostridia bacterium]